MSVFNRGEIAALIQMLNKSTSNRIIEEVAMLGVSSHQPLKYYLLGLDPDEDAVEVGKLWLAIKMCKITSSRLAKFTSITRQAWDKAFKRNRLPVRITIEDKKKIADAVGCSYIYKEGEEIVTYKYAVEYERGRKIAGRELFIKRAQQQARKAKVNK